MLLLVSKVTKNARVAIPSRSNAAQVWNALYATNRGNLKPCSLRSLARQISARFSQAYRHLPAVLALALCLLSAYSAIVMWGFSPHPCGLMWASAPTRSVLCTNRVGAHIRLRRTCLPIRADGLAAASWTSRNYPHPGRKREAKRLPYEVCDCTIPL